MQKKRLIQTKEKILGKCQTNRCLELHNFQKPIFFTILELSLTLRRVVPYDEVRGWTKSAPDNRAYL